jgi:hypothetical protein
MSADNVAGDYAAELRVTLDRARDFLYGINDEAASYRTAAGKWSPKEIIGRLIDSASNNHERFVRAQFNDDLEFSGYDQDAWVSAQHYRDAYWGDLVALWYYFNLHIARLMETAAIDERVRPRARHNLHQIAWRPVPQNEPATLDYFMRDYVGHLKHHLAQLGFEAR